MLNFKKIGHRIIVAICIVVTISLAGIVVFSTINQEKSILEQNERAIRKVTESVISALKIVMLSGNSDIAQEYAESLKQIPDINDFRLMRTDGSEAFMDNATINAINAFMSDTVYPPRKTEATLSVMKSNSPELHKALSSDDISMFYETADNGEQLLTFLAPIKNEENCHGCHDPAQKVRGLLKLTTSLAPIHAKISQTWKESLIGLAVALIAVIVITNLLVRHTVVLPIARVTEAMKSASSGNLGEKVPVLGRDELSAMASSFNAMTKELLETYNGLHNEQNKLTTIILSSQEGIIVTDGSGHIVLINPATEKLLGKSRADIERDGFDLLFDNPDQMLAWKQQSTTSNDPVLVEYNGLKLSVHISTIIEQGKTLGSSALIFDITAQDRLETELRKLSNTDGLTQLYNRRFLDITLAKELERSRRYSLPLSALMFDVDHFKKFNDTYGHDQGDRVLQTIAKVMQETCRTVDFPCRYGGEEFFIIIPNTELKGAITFAERVRAGIEGTAVDGLNVTVSIGVACALDHQPKSAEHFISLCDGALYKAKEAGRNQVVVAEIDS